MLHVKCSCVSLTKRTQEIHEISSLGNRIHCLRSNLPTDKRNRVFSLSVTKQIPMQLQHTRTHLQQGPAEGQSSKPWRAQHYSTRHLCFHTAMARRKFNIDLFCGNIRKYRNLPFNFCPPPKEIILTFKDMYFYTPSQTPFLLFQVTTSNPR